MRPSDLIRNFRQIRYHEPERRRPLALAYLRLISAILSERLRRTKGYCEVPVFDWKVACFSRDTALFLFEEIFIHRTYAFRPKNENALVVDCGSNIGMSILYFLQLVPQARIMGFEPDPDTFRLLSENVARNRLKQVTVVNTALQDYVGETEFHRDRRAPGALTMTTSPVRAGATFTAIRVRASRLSEFVNGAIDYLKVDIEGDEQLVLNDLIDSGKIKLVREMCIEYHHHTDSRRDELGRCLSLLEAAGFGYQIRALFSPPWIERRYQDVLIYAYSKESW